MEFQKYNVKEKKEKKNKQSKVKKIIKNIYVKFAEEKKLGLFFFAK